MGVGVGVGVCEGGAVLGRIVIDDVRPRTPSGEHRPKAAVGEAVPVSADVFKDGHDLLAARVRGGPSGPLSGGTGPSGPLSGGTGPSGPLSGGTGPSGDRSTWATAPLIAIGNDRFDGVLTFDHVGPNEVVVEAWVDTFATWRRDVRAKAGAGLDLTTEVEEGAVLLDALAPHTADEQRAKVRAAATVLRRPSASTEERLNAGLDDALAAALAGVVVPSEVTTAGPFPLWVDRELGLAGAWYELFPRSEGGLMGTAKRLPALADMGFDVVYLPPIHPIGHTARKGRDNHLEAAPEDVGSPWAIGSEEGGHLAVHADLGTIDDLDALVAEAAAHGLEIALDYALQCSPDHPWVRAHPEWFHHRPDGSIKCAENPPKKYQDIYPINFWPADEADRRALWAACRDILEFWIDHGVKVFRVDNPHTKPMAFWAETIAAIQWAHADVVFLAEAFTRPKVMAKLAEVGFTQSYTYFTWRTTKAELTEYVTELSSGSTADYMRPNFWPNTPDILAEPLRHGSPATFRTRLVLAATLAPSYGIYSGYELCENEPQSDANEEYLRSEKYEVKERDWLRPDSLAPLMRTLNHTRRAHPALRTLRGTTFHHSANDALIVYSRATDDRSDVVLCVVNLDPDGVQEDTLWLDLDALGLSAGEPYEAHDELTDETYTWWGPDPYVRLDPASGPAHVLHLRRRS